MAILDDLIGNDAPLTAMADRATVNAQVAMLIFEARTRAGLTQRQLADLIGSRQPVIARLEDAEYQGHSLSMLQRIAAALRRRLVIRLAPVKGKLSLRKAG